MKQWFERIGKTEVRNLLAFTWVISTIVLVLVLVFKPIPRENHELLYMAVGTYIAHTGLVLSYYFGASKTETDREKKDD